jgi:hypothetical protein
MRKYHATNRASAGDAFLVVERSEAATRRYRAIGSLPDAAAAGMQATRVIDGTSDM